MDVGEDGAECSARLLVIGEGSDVGCEHEL